MTDPDLPGLLTGSDRSYLRELDRAPVGTWTGSDAVRLRQILQEVLERTGPFFDEAYRRGLEWQREYGETTSGGIRWPRRRSNSYKRGSTV